MAELKKKFPAYVFRLRDALGTELAELGIRKPKVSFEHVPGTKLYRFEVIAPGFQKLRHSERQELVWRITDKELDKKKLYILSILTLTPSEASGESAA